MKINVIGAACALALSLAVSSLLAVDNDSMKSDMSTSPKMEGSSSEMKGGMKPDMGMSSKMMDSKLYEIQCGSPCDFEVKSHDKQEVIALALNHVKIHHNMPNATEKDVEAMVKVVEPSK